VVGDEGRPWMIREDCYGRATVALTRAIQHTYIVSPLDMAGMIEVSSWLSWQGVDADRLPVVVRFPAGPRVSLKW